MGLEYTAPMDERGRKNVIIVQGIPRTQGGSEEDSSHFWITALIGFKGIGLAKLEERLGTRASLEPGR